MAILGSNLQKFFLIGFAGGLGALARYGLAGIVQKHAGFGVPWGTATVNLVGCFLFGLLWVSMEERFPVTADTRIVVLAGFMGAFTTFSTFVFETQQLLEDSQYLAALGSVALQNGGGLAAVILGMAAGKWI